MAQAGSAMHPESHASSTTPGPTTAVNTASDQPQSQSSGAKVFRCSVPHCGRLFNRKEHLRRHLKSHNPNPPHECRICGRRYARSDVLKRHIENHPVNPHPRQPRMPPCSHCVERKTRCHGGTPCQACVRASIECIRPTGHWMSSLDGDGEVVTVNEDNVSPGSHGDNNNDRSNGNCTSEQRQQRQHVSEPSSAATESAYVHASGQDNSPASNALFSSEHDTPWLAADSASQYSWPLLSLAGISPNTTPTTNLLSTALVPNGQTSSHIATTESTDSTLIMQGTGLNMGLPSTESNQDGHHQTSDMPMNDGPILSVPAMNGTMLDGLSTVLNGVVLSGSSNNSSPQNSLLSSGSTQTSEPLQDFPMDDTQSAKQLVESYFRDVHPIWPILHEPTFSIDKCSPILLHSILILGSLTDNTPDHLTLAPVADNTIKALQSVVEEQFIPLETLQAMLLFLVYCISYPGRGETVFRALRLNGFLIAALRYQRVFAGMQYLEAQVDEHDAFQCWFTQEAHNRLAYACLRADAYLSIVLDQPPSVRYFELSIPLPKSASLWSARSAEERSGLQWSTPAGREKVLFCHIVRDSLEDSNERHWGYPLTGLDYHLSLCALQAGVWDAAREAHSFASDELSTKMGPGAPIIVWRRHLEFWRRCMERNGRFACNYHGANGPTVGSTTADDEPFAPITMIMWHVSNMKMHAPIANLQASAAVASKNKRLSVAAAMPTANFPHFDICARIRSWMGIRCSRVSCWNAAQITHVVCHEAADPVRARRLRLNPLACHGLFMAAVVVASYTFYFQSCGICGVVDPTLGMPPAVDLFLAKEGDEALHAWWDTGMGYGVWGPKRIPLCRCKLDDLIEWLRETLASVDTDLASSFVAFTEKLKLD